MRRKMADNEAKAFSVSIVLSEESFELFGGMFLSPILNAHNPNRDGA